MQTILIVDDDESFHFLCEIQFCRSEKDYKLLKAYDGVEALEILRRTGDCPDLILLGINMPRMDGHEFLEEFAKINSGEIPIVAMLTSTDQQSDKQKALS